MCPCEEAPSKPRPPKGLMTILSVGGLSAALLASVCCIGPLVFAALSVGIGATDSWPARPESKGTLAVSADLHRPDDTSVEHRLLFGLWEATVRSMRARRGVCSGNSEWCESGMVLDRGGVRAGADPGALLVGAVTIRRS